VAVANKDLKPALVWRRFETNCSDCSSRKLSVFKLKFRCVTERQSLLMKAAKADSEKNNRLLWDWGEMAHWT
jgi:hypothetical protein